MVIVLLGRGKGVVKRMNSVNFSDGRRGLAQVTVIEPDTHSSRARAAVRCKAYTARTQDSETIFCNSSAQTRAVSEAWGHVHIPNSS